MAAVSDPVVLVADDEPTVAETYALRIQDVYRTRTANSGTETLETIDDDIDAVLLDRRMPDIHGDDVLREIRRRGYDCRIIMLTAIEPNLNILEMQFDDYLCKPVSRKTLLTTLERHLETRETETDERVAEFVRTVSKIKLLEAELSRAELADSDQFERLKHRAGELRSQIDDVDEILDGRPELQRNA